jgi:hypothetical protein
MEEKTHKIYHGEITPAHFAKVILSNFNRGNLRVQQQGTGDHIILQIATINQPRSGGQTALTIHLNKVKDGVSVQTGKQAWLGIAASLGLSALSALKNPMSLLNRIDDIAQDIEYIQLSDEIWQILDDAAEALGANHLLSKRLSSVACEFCGTGNPVGSGSCIACGAPLGKSQPVACPHCGFVLDASEVICSNCKKRI